MQTSRLLPLQVLTIGAIVPRIRVFPLILLCRRAVFPLHVMAINATSSTYRWFALNFTVQMGSLPFTSHDDRRYPFHVQAVQP